jgi:hypothetical protein
MSTDLVPNARRLQYTMDPHEERYQRIVAFCEECLGFTPSQAEVAALDDLAATIARVLVGQGYRVQGETTGEAHENARP